MRNSTGRKRVASGHFTLVATLIALGAATSSCTAPFTDTLARLNQIASRQEAALAPTSKGPKPQFEEKGTIAARFDLGQTLIPADFLTISTKQTAGFGILQSKAFNLKDIHKAVVTITSSQIEAPAEAELTRDELGAGWSTQFKGIPVGSANVTLRLIGKAGQELFEESREVEVEANLVTPVEFLVELESGSPGCLQNLCTGSVKVTVQARTQCFGRLLPTPAIVKAGESLLLKANDLTGNISEFALDFGDGSPVQTVASLPVRHTYGQEGRYRIVTVLKGAGCRNPYTANSYVTVEK